MENEAIIFIAAFLSLSYTAKTGQPEDIKSRALRAGIEEVKCRLLCSKTGEEGRLFMLCGAKQAANRFAVRLVEKKARDGVEGRPCFITSYMILYV